jgi:hypothetical protein
MFVNGLPFLVTSSRGISLVTIIFAITNCKVFSTYFRTSDKVYTRGGFVVQTMMMDMEFEKLVNLLPNVTINTTAAMKHVGEIERKIRVIKERARGTMNTLPYPKLSRLMTIELMHFLHHVDERFSSEVGCLRKMEPERTDLTPQAGC